MNYNHCVLFELTSIFSSISRHSICHWGNLARLDYPTTRLGVVLQRLTIIGMCRIPILRRRLSAMTPDGIPQLVNCRLKTLYFSRTRRLKTLDPRLSPDWLARPVGPNNIAAGRTKQNHIFLKLLYYSTTWKFRRTHRKHRFLEFIHCSLTSVQSRRRVYYATA
jgi:hypothetical protein